MLLATSIFLALTALDGSDQGRQICSEEVMRGASQVSMIELVANPEAFDGKVVRVIGYVVKATNLYYLYLDEGVALRNDSAGAIVVATANGYFEVRADGIELAKEPTGMKSRSYREINGRFRWVNGMRYFGSVCAVNPVNSAPPEVG